MFQFCKCLLKTYKIKAGNRALLRAFVGIFWKRSSDQSSFFVSPTKIELYCFFWKNESRALSMQWKGGYQITLELFFHRSLLHNIVSFIGLFCKRDQRFSRALSMQWGGDIKSPRTFFFAGLFWKSNRNMTLFFFLFVDSLSRELSLCSVICHITIKCHCRTLFQKSPNKKIAKLDFIFVSPTIELRLCSVSY